MNIIGKNNLELYNDIKAIGGKEHIKLVKNRESGELFVKKSFDCCDINIYRELYMLNIDNIPKIEDIYLTDSGVVIIEEYIKGMTVEERVLKNGVFSESETVDIIKQLCEILSVLHNHRPSVIHRDIKPSNVLLTKDNRVVLIDFNGAKFEKGQENRDTVLMGTVGHAAPEQYGFGASSTETDIYAIGILMNYMLTGQLPTERLYDKKLKNIIKHCVELNPKDRFSNAEKLLKELNRYNTKYNPLLPPGFRSKKIPNMITAVLGYSALAYLIYEFAVSYTVLYEMILYSTACGMGFIIVILFYCNYLNIKRFFPFMKSKNKIIRVIGLIINPFIIIGTLIISAVLFDVFVIHFDDFIAAGYE